MCENYARLNEALALCSYRCHSREEACLPGCMHVSHSAREPCTAGCVHRHRSPGASQCTVGCTYIALVGVPGAPDGLFSLCIGSGSIHRCPNAPGQSKEKARAVCPLSLACRLTGTLRCWASGLCLETDHVDVNEVFSASAVTVCAPPAPPPPPAPRPRCTAELILCKAFRVRHDAGPPPKRQRLARRSALPAVVPGGLPEFQTIRQRARDKVADQNRRVSANHWDTALDMIHSMAGGKCRAEVDLARYRRLLKSAGDGTHEGLVALAAELGPRDADVVARVYFDRDPQPRMREREVDRDLAIRYAQETVRAFDLVNEIPEIRKAPIHFAHFSFSYLRARADGLADGKGGWWIRPSAELREAIPAIEDDIATLRSWRGKAQIRAQNTTDVSGQLPVICSLVEKTTRRRLPAAYSEEAEAE